MEEGGGEDEGDSAKKVFITLAMRFGRNSWIEEEKILELIHTQCGEGKVEELYPLKFDSTWHVTVNNRQTAEYLVEKGLKHELNGISYLCYGRDINDKSKKVVLSRIQRSYPDHKIHKILEEFGEVMKIERQFTRPGIGNGKCNVKMIIKKDIPRLLSYPKEEDKDWSIGVWYWDQPAVQQEKPANNQFKRCYICKFVGHIADECPRKKICRVCNDPTARPHLERDCNFRKEREKERNENIERDEALKGIVDALTEMQEIKHGKNTRKEKTESLMQTEENIQSTSSSADTQKSKLSSESLSDMDDEKDQIETEKKVMKIITDSQGKRMEPFIQEHIKLVAISGATIRHGTENGFGDETFERTVLYLGTNNINSSTNQLKQDTDNMINRAKKQSKEVFVMGIIPRLQRKSYSSKINEINEYFKSISERKKVAYIPPPKKFLKSGESSTPSDFYEDDLIHINEKGANELLLAIEKATKISVVKVRPNKRKLGDSNMSPNPHNKTRTIEELSPIEVLNTELLKDETLEIVCDMDSGEDKNA